MSRMNPATVERDHPRHVFHHDNLGSQPLKDKATVFSEEVIPVILKGPLRGVDRKSLAWWPTD